MLVLSVLSQHMFVPFFCFDFVLFDFVERVYKIIGHVVMCAASLSMLGEVMLRSKT